MLVTYTDASGNEVLVTPTNPLPTSAGAAAGSSATDPVKVSGTLGALNATLPITIGQRDTLSMHVLGTFVGSIVLQGSGDGNNWVSLTGPTQWQTIATNTNLGTITAVGLYQTTVSALAYVRVLMSAYTSGSASIYLEAVDGNAAVFLDSPLPAGGNTIGTVNLGTGTITNSLGRVGIFDGTNSGTIKAASTAPTATDTSLVSTLSPNYAAAGQPHFLSLAATTNATVMKAAAGSIIQLDVTNHTGSPFFLKLYNLAAAPTVGTSVPIDTILIPTGDARLIDFGQYGKRFSTGIAYATTGAATDADATAIVLTSGPAKVGATYL